MATNLITLITDVLGGLEDTVSTMEPIIDTLVIDRAEGIWLDTIGTIVGCPPRTRNIDGTSPVTDAEYRTRINVQIGLNNGGSTMEVITNAVRFYLYLYADDTANTWEGVKAETVNITSDKATLVINTKSGASSKYVGEIKKFLPVGVGLYILQIPENPFVVSKIGGSYGFGGGCGTKYNPNAGGALAYFVDTNTK